MKYLLTNCPVICPPYIYFCVVFCLSFAKRVSCIYFIKCRQEKLYFTNFHPFFQVSKLVILHEEAEEGIPMPDLQQPVRSVSNAVFNLVKVTFHLFENFFLHYSLLFRLVEIPSTVPTIPFSAKICRRRSSGSKGLLSSWKKPARCSRMIRFRHLLEKD